MDKLGTQCSAFGCSKRKKSIKNKGELCRRNLSTSQGYLFLILQYSATEICNFAKFTMFFQVESAENFSKFCLKGYTLNKNYTNNIAKKTINIIQKLYFSNTIQK